MSIISDTLQWLSKELYPTGRAFRVPENGVLYRLHRSLNLNLADAYKDATQILNDILPDNALFTIDDAHDWYRRLGLFDSGSVSLADMKQAILQKLSFPLTPLNKQNYLFIQQQLQAAGFNVYVHENRWPDGSGGYQTKTPEQVLGSFANVSLHSTTSRHGAIRHKGLDRNIIANYIEEEKDASFLVGSNYKSTFFICGPTIAGIAHSTATRHKSTTLHSRPALTYATVPTVRKQEFRQLILKLKPLQTIGFLFVNYT